jgi:hypothetical protein
VQVGRSLPSILTENANFDTDDSEARVLLWVALAAAGGMTLLALRSMTLAFAMAVESRPARISHTAARRQPQARRRSYYASREAAMLMTEIALSAGIVLTIVGLARMAALPPMMMIGAVLAQTAVLGSLVAPAVAVNVRGVSARPAALALAVAQFANVAFFVKAIQALL